MSSFASGKLWEIRATLASGNNNGEKGILPFGQQDYQHNPFEALALVSSETFSDEMMVTRLAIETLIKPYRTT